MRRSRRLVSATVVLALSVASASPVLASGDESHNESSDASTTGSALTTTTAPPSLTEGLLRTLRTAKSALEASPAPRDAKKRVIEQVEDTIDRVEHGQIPSDSELRALKAEIDRILAAPSTPPPSSSPTSPRPTPSSPTPSSSTPTTVTQGLVTTLESALKTLRDSALPAEKKAEFHKKLSALLEKAKRNKVSPSDVDNALREMRSALSSSTSETSPPSGGTAVTIPGTAPGKGSGKSSGSHRTTAPVPSQPGDSAQTTEKPHDDEHSSGSNTTEDDHESEDSEHNDREDRFSRPSTPIEAATKLNAQLSEVRSRLIAMGASEPQAALLVTLDELTVRLTSGDPVTPEETRAFFTALRSFVEKSSGRTRSEAPNTTPSKPSPSQLQARMVGAIAEALTHLGDLATPEAVKARDAMTAMSTRIANGEVPTKDEFEAAMKFVKEALAARPGSRQAIALAGVIAQVRASSAPDDVKQSIVEKLQRAQDAASARPDTDASDLVRAALEEARAARVAAAVEKIGALAVALKDASTALDNTSAALLCDEALSLLVPVDGSLPTRDTLHEVRETLRLVIEMLSPSTEDSPDSSTVPTSVVTLPADGSTTTSPASPTGIPVRP